MPLEKIFDQVTDEVKNEAEKSFWDTLKDFNIWKMLGKFGEFISWLGDSFKNLFSEWFGTKEESKEKRDALAQSIFPYSNQYREQNPWKFDHLNTKPWVNGLLDMIGKIEWAGNYNAIVGQPNQSIMDFSRMSIREVIAYQDTMKSKWFESTAVWKYQVIQGTLKETVAKHGIDLDAKFNPAMQDKIATYLMERRWLNSFIAGRMDLDTFQKNLSMEWAALPKDNSNKSFYKWVGSNKALISSSKFREQLSQIA